MGLLEFDISIASSMDILATVEVPVIIYAKGCINYKEESICWWQLMAWTQNKDNLILSPAGQSHSIDDIYIYIQQAQWMAETS